MKQVATYLTSEDAYLARAHLEGNGIEAFVRDENAVTMTGLPTMLGGVKLDVADDQYEAAVAFLGSSGVPLGRGPERPPSLRRFFANLFR